MNYLTCYVQYIERNDRGDAEKNSEKLITHVLCLLFANKGMRPALSLSILFVYIFKDLACL